MRIAHGDRASDKHEVFILLHRMHARAVAPLTALGYDHAPSAKITTFTSTGWEQWLDEALEADGPVVPTVELTECKRCAKMQVEATTDHRAAGSCLCPGVDDSPTQPTRAVVKETADTTYVEQTQKKVVRRARQEKDERGSHAERGAGRASGNTPEAKELVEHYIDQCVQQEKFEAKAFKEIVDTGTQLLKATGHWEPSVALLRETWIARYGNSLDGIKDPALDHLVPGDLLSYVRDVVENGAPARQDRPEGRWRTKPHRSAQDHIEEAYEKAWKDIHKGRALICSAELDSELHGILAEPMGRVPKQNPDRTLSAEGRFVHDERNVNSYGNKYDHPPAIQPRHRELARTILWWKVRLPGVKVLMAKYDVDSAYKLIWLRQKDVCLFATELPGAVIGVEGNVMIISLSLTFGYHGAPGEYMAFAWTNKLVYQAAKPAQPEWHDEVPFHCKTLMDDQVMIEPDVGVRCHVAAWWAQQAMKWVFGDEALNLKKLEEEGRFEPTKINWGIDYDTEKETIVLPEPKVQKLSYIVNEPAFAYGSVQVPISLARTLIGVLVYGACTCPIIKAELGALYQMLGVSDEGHANVRLQGDAAKVQRSWEEIWGALDLLRVLVEDPLAWASHFTTGLAAVLTTRERLALPGVIDKLVWTGGDSTLQTLGAADWNAKIYGFTEVAKLAGALRKFAGHDEEEDVIIAIGELLCFLVLAATRKAAWHERLVIYVTDNSNTESWLEKRVARNALARYGLRLLGMMEIQENFQVITVGISTHHNATMDYLTRAKSQAVRDEMNAKGFTEVDLWPGWNELLTNTERGCPLAPPGADHQSRTAAWRVTLRRRPTPIVQINPSMRRLRLDEWRATLGSYAKTWRDRGAVAALLQDDRKGRFDWSAVDDTPATTDARKLDGKDCLCASLSPDKDGVELCRFVEAVKRGRYAWALVDAPKEAQLDDGITALEKSHTVSQFDVLTSWYGDRTARKRRCMLAAPCTIEDAGRRFLERLQFAEVASPEGPRGVLLPIDAVDPLLWENRKSKNIPRMRADEDDFLPVSVGTFAEDDGTKSLVHSTTNPMPTMKAQPANGWDYGQVIIHDERRYDQTAGDERRLAPFEVWRIQGHSAAEWRRLLDREVTTELLMHGAAQAMPIRTAQALTGALLETIAEEPRAGVGPDRDEELAWETWSRWLAAWKRRPDAPAPEFQQWLDDRKALRAGGESRTIEVPTGRASGRDWPVAVSDVDLLAYAGLQGVRSGGRASAPPPGSTTSPRASERKPRARSMPDPQDALTPRRKSRKTGEELEIESLFNISSLRWAPEEGDGAVPIVGGADFSDIREEQILHFIASKIGSGTQGAYASGWRLWTWFMRARKKDPFLKGRNEAQVSLDEDKLLDFIVHLVQLFHRTEGTIKSKLMAIRFHHLSNGLPDPLDGKERVWLALGGIKRLQGRASRRLPITVSMLRWAEERYTRGDSDGLVLFVAAVTAWFFLLRMGEYTTNDKAGWRCDRVVTGRDVTPRREGKEVQQFRDADEIVLYIKGSKTDQFNVGCIRNHYRTGDEICPVVAMERLQKRFPERWEAESHLPLFRLASGKLLPVTALSRFTKEAGAAVGADPDLFDTHSLKIGGATAMYHGSGEFATVKRFGRWATDTVHDYLWEVHERQKGLAASMVKHDYELTAPTAKPKQTLDTGGKTVTFNDAAHRGSGMPEALVAGCMLCGVSTSQFPLNDDYVCTRCATTTPPPPPRHTQGRPSRGLDPHCPSLCARPYDGGNYRPHMQSARSAHSHTRAPPTPLWRTPPTERQLRDPSRRRTKNARGRRRTLTGACQGSSEAHRSTSRAVQHLRDRLGMARVHSTTHGYVDVTTAQERFGARSQ